MYYYSRMKWLPAILVLLVVFSAHAGEKTYLKRDPLRSDRYQITDSRGKVKGYLKRSILDPRKIKITDATGKTTGYIKKDILQPTRTKWGVYNSAGEREATIQQDIFRPSSRYQIETHQGETGIIKPDVMQSDRYVIEPD
jgi:uncharacterized protein YxjI